MKLKLLFFLLTFPIILFGFRKIDVTKNENLALSGYDTVAYFKEGKAVKGSAAYSVEWEGAVWRFYSKTNLKLFKNDPHHYAPQFGGYCSYALSNHKTVSCNPRAFMIYEGKLYVLRNQDILLIWSQNPKKYIELGRRNWEALLNSKSNEN